MSQHFIVLRSEFIGTSQPRFVVMSSSFLGVINLHDHGSQKWGLRASQIVRAVGVQNRPVMLDFKEEVLHHYARQVDSPIVQQPQNDEITVPTIHFVETATGHNVTIRKEQQPLRRNTFQIGLPRMKNDYRQVFDAHFTGLLHPLYGIWFWKVGWQIQQ